MIKKHSYYFLFFGLVAIFSCKPKTELYLERGLDILSNVKEVEFNIYQDIVIKEIGVIRDQKEETKTLVFKLDNNANEETFKNNYVIGLKAWIMDENNKERKENWDFRPELIKSNGYNYFVNKINIKEDKIKKMKIYAYQNLDGEKREIGSSILLHKIYTYND
ncbi:hypothetical protein ACFQ0R_05215 [Psychroflexus salinarum]|uniref:Lipoprotein n=1 Tax=Psychroflexus salinarum TaxID=546024 RepID=A0ABW3GN66_9FLAO